MDFTKKLGKAQTQKVIDPRAIYETLDRASDKGPLRPAQDSILKAWHETRRNDKDLIIKLQTGQGKTLIGLLMLQARLNEGLGPAVYLCANNFLADQTRKQAREFGITNLCDDPDDSDFIAGRSILINNVTKLFNGLTRFQLGSQSHAVGTVLLDDSHACADSIRSTFSINLKAGSSLYAALRDLFETDLENQGLGSYADIKLGKFDSVLPVPYWAWKNRLGDVTRFIAKAADSDELKYTWPLLKDSLADCACVFSGTGLEIAPYLPDLSLFGSYWRAKSRIFMSATVTNDAFLVKGLNLAPDVIRKPLTYDGEKWYGEKMVLIPSLIDGSLSRTAIIDGFAGISKKRKSGVVALVPGSKQARDWKTKGAHAVDRTSIVEGVKRLRDKQFSETVVIANYYDGIDLPDDACRILILDSKPFANGLIDTYADSCRASSEITSLKLARTIEQGLGRAVRGQKDYCVVLLIGANLVRAIRSGRSRLQFSEQTQQQVAIGLTVSEDAKGEVGEGVDPPSVLNTLINQCLGRDDGWKAYYAQEMQSLTVVASEPKLLEVFAAELKAEQQYRDGAFEEAKRTTQKLIDTHYGPDDLEDRAWYLQEMARYMLPVNASESNDLQVKAHKKNKLLLKPQSGFVFEPLIIPEKRITAIKTWMKSFESNEALILGGEEILADLSFGVAASDFEEALRKLGLALGFASQRPDKEWKEGPDNLWGLREGEFLLIEAKNEVDSERTAIHKDETGQMNNACAWFKKHYPGAKVSNLMVIPTKDIAKAAGFNDPVQVMQRKQLNDLKNRFRAFLLEFKQVDLHDLADETLQRSLQKHWLTSDDVTSKYGVDPLPALP